MRQKQNKSSVATKNICTLEETLVHCDCPNIEQKQTKQKYTNKHTNKQHTQ